MSRNILTQVDLRDRDIAHEYSENKVGVSLKDVMPGLYNKMYNTPQKRRIHDSNFAFVTTALSKLHEKVVEPKYNVTYMKDIPINVGGGMVDYVDYYSVDWLGDPLANQAVVGNNVNIVPRVNAKLNHRAVEVFNFEIAYDIKFIEIDKLDKIQFTKSIEAIYRDAIIASWDLFNDEIAYMGRNGSGGLFNHPDAQQFTLAAGTQDTTKDGFAAMTDAEIVGVFNGILSYYLTNSNNNLSVIPDTFLLPMADAAIMSGRFSSLLNATLREFVMNHNVGIDEAMAADEGDFKIKIKGRARLNGAGDLEAGRIVAYRYNEEFLRMDQPYPMQLYYTGPNVDKACYTTYFVGQVSLLQLPYNGDKSMLNAVTYWDLAKGTPAGGGGE